jgi:hypothetical protein
MEEQVLKQKHRESQMKELESKGKQLEDWFAGAWIKGDGIWSSSEGAGI